MVKFWSIVVIGIVVVLLVAANTDLYALDAKEQIGWGFALLYALIQIDLAKLERENLKLELRIQELEEQARGRIQS